VDDTPTLDEIDQALTYAAPTAEQHPYFIDRLLDERLEAQA
jgi:hypothetical protein